MRNPSAYEIVQDYHRAWTNGDVDRAMDQVSDDVVCRAPGVHLVGKSSYRQLIAGFAPAADA